MKLSGKLVPIGVMAAGALAIWYGYGMFKKA